jgi:peptide/nickel transport system substrate-binding protein/oligopeptide transport system substrate-binding protein
MVTAIAHVDGDRVFGTGPFRVAARTPDRIILERNPNSWRSVPARLDTVEFHAPLSASAIAAGLRSGELDLGRDLLPQDLERILREPQFRAGITEAPKRNTYFALFNKESPMGSNLALRRALAGAVRTQDLVWGALGRFALPATGLLPPGMLGHDAGRRRTHLSHDEVVELLRSSGLPLPLSLRASVHPFLTDRFRALTSALLGTWRELGVDVSIEVSTMAEYLQTWERNAEIDLLIGRWNADYDDPDTFTFSLFHGRSGMMRGYLSSPQIDRLLEEARVESRPVVREGLYRKFESLLLESAALIPLFHEVDYRIANPNVRGLNLRSIPPYISYADLGKVQAPAPDAATVPRWGGGIVQVPIAGVVQSLDASIGYSVEQDEVTPSVFEGLFRVTENRILPWLAAGVGVEDDGRRYRFRLRRGVRFHDGRALTSRDVRYSYERLLQNPESETRSFLAPIRGASRLIDGTATDLEGFHIVSPMEFLIDLEKPLSFFPALLSCSPAGVLPEGTGALGRSWREGCVGTGPFRVVEFEPGRRLELERNPYYWRDGYPRSEGVAFRFGVPPEEIKSEFLAGRFSLASDLLPADVEALRHDGRFASGYRESPRLITYFVALNNRRGVLGDERLRRALADSIDAPAIVGRTLGRLALPATGLIPPGLLGHTGTPRRRGPGHEAQEVSAAPTRSKEPVEVTAAIHPIFFAEYSALARELLQAFHGIGVSVRTVNKTMSEYRQACIKGEADMVLGRWGADYLDADTFVRGALHSQEGWFGRCCGSPEIDQRAERAQSEVDPRVRHSLYRQVEEILEREAILLPLFHEQVYRFARSEVEGLAVGFSYPIVAYEDLWIRQ